MRVPLTRAEIAGRLMPTIRRDVETNLQRLYTQARREAAPALAEQREVEARDALQESCPYALSRLLDDDWLPGNR